MRPAHFPGRAKTLHTITSVSRLLFVTKWRGSPAAASDTASVPAEHGLCIAAPEITHLGDKLPTVDNTCEIFMINDTNSYDAVK